MSGEAAVIVSEGLFDKDFVVQRTVGFEEPGKPEDLRRLLVRGYPLDRVAAETGVPVHVILRVGREFAASRDGLAVGPRQGPLLPGRLFDHMAAQTLNALAGKIDALGGVLDPKEVPWATWPKYAPDRLAAAGRARPRLDGAGGPDRPRLSSDPEELAEAILAGAPYPAEILMVLGADPAFTILHAWRGGAWRASGVRGA